MSKYLMSGSARLAVKGNLSVILDPGRGKYYSLSAVGTCVCVALATPRTLGDILTIVQESFAIGASEPTGDVVGFLDNLIALG